MPTIEKPETTERLFCGVYPCGLVYADRARDQDGDYMRLAFLSYATLVLEWDKNTMPPELRAAILASAEAMQAKRGQQFKISACAQYVTLGQMP